jgi:UDP-4-amino-4-deoxy-L-arabinose-oxoglutarate aminotransferase
LKAKVPFFLHDLGTAELAAVAEVLAGPILTTGETVARFERSFAEYLGVRHAIGLTSCTAAIHLSLEALGVGEGDEVLTTPMTFIATATAIMHARAKPVFIDVEPETGNLDATRIEAAITERTRAIVPVHLYGQMCDMRAIRAIADRHGLFVVEDAAHCVEGSREGIRPGQLGDTACFSFYGTKSLTCGEGGAVVTKNDALAEKLRLLRLHGMNKSATDRQREGYEHWDMLVLGWKYNMDNIQAALLLPQMERIEANRQKRSQLAARYEKHLSKLSGVRTPRVPPGVQHAHHLFPIWVRGDARDDVIARMQDQGIPVVVNYRAIHLLTFFRTALGHSEGDFPIAEGLGGGCLSLPLYPDMTDEQIKHVCSAIRSFSA